MPTCQRIGNQRTSAVAASRSGSDRAGGRRPRRRRAQRRSDETGRAGGQTQQTAAVDAVGRVHQHLRRPRTRMKHRIDSRCRRRSSVLTCVGADEPAALIVLMLLLLLLLLLLVVVVLVLPVLVLVLLQLLLPLVAAVLVPLVAVATVVVAAANCAIARVASFFLDSLSLSLSHTRTRTHTHTNTEFCRRSVVATMHRGCDRFTGVGVGGGRSRSVSCRWPLFWWK